MTKIYIVYNRWQMDSETWEFYFLKAFSSEEDANKYKDKLEKEEKGGNDHYAVEAVDFE